MKISGNNKIYDSNSLNDISPIAILGPSVKKIFKVEIISSIENKIDSKFRNSGIFSFLLFIISIDWFELSEKTWDKLINIKKEFIEKYLVQ